MGRKKKSETDSYMEHCIECCSHYCCGDEPMGNELCLCDCYLVCIDILDVECFDDEEFEGGEYDEWI